MLQDCLIPITSISGLGVILNAVLLVFLFKEKNSIALKSILISISCSNIALSLVLASRTIIPLYLKDNSSTSFAAFIFGIYCNMINILLMTTERMTATFCYKINYCCSQKSFLLIIIVLFWIACIPLAIALGVIDLYDGIAIYVETEIVPINCAAASLISIALHLVMCSRIHYELKQDMILRSTRSIGHGLIITSRKGLALRQEYRHVGLSFALVICYTVFNYPYMLYSFLQLEKGKHCDGLGMDLYNVLVMLLAFKAVVDPFICICITVCIPRYWKQLRQHENESST